MLADQPPAIVEVMHDYGGKLAKYQNTIRKYKKQNVSVRILGGCLSACTLLFQLPKEQLCIARTAMFGFHLPSGPNEDDVAYWAVVMWELYPKVIQDKLRDLTPQFAFISGDELLNASNEFRECSAWDSLK